MTRKDGSTLMIGSQDPRRLLAALAMAGVATRGQAAGAAAGILRFEGAIVSERTLTILKPDAVAAGKAGAILAHLEKEGFRLLAMKRMRLSPDRRALSTPSTGSALSTKGSCGS